MSNEIQVYDPNTTKLEQLEVELEEVKANLMTVADAGQVALLELVKLAKTSQHHMVYQALASVIKANNETNRTLGDTLMHKKSLYETNNKNNEPLSGEKSSSNTNILVMSSNEVLSMIEKKNAEASK